jgi:hypothetical protein
MPPIQTYNADIHTQVEPRMKARLADIAAEQGIPLSQVVRQILRAWFSDRDSKSGKAA